MPKSESIIVLANSYKLQARCIAGKLSEAPDKWIRPVNSAHHGGALSERDILFSNGKAPALLDIVRVRFLGKSAHSYQTENCQIDEDTYWEKIGTASKEQIAACSDNKLGPLWSNALSSGGGSRDRIAETEAPDLQSSLRFILVDDLSVIVEEGYGNKKRVRGTFNLQQEFYNLGITDPLPHSYYLDQGTGIYRIGRCYLCISIGELFQGYAYKLIAGMVTP